MYVRQIALLVAMITYASAASTYSNSTLTSLIFPVAALSIQQDSTSLYYPDDFYLSQIVAKTKIYTLGSNNIVQVYDKASLCSPIQIFEDYSYRYNSSSSFVYMSINQQQDTLVLTSFTSSGLKHLVFELGADGIESLRNETILHAQSTSPKSVFVRNSSVYSYFHGTDNDYIWVIDITTQYNYTIVLSVSLGELVLAPNREKAVVWDNCSKLYIYSVANNFSLEYIYNASAGSPTNRTGHVSFSGDSELILLQTDNKNPIRVINLSDFSTLKNITSTGNIFNVVFLDYEARLILIEATTGTYLYDMTNQQSQILDNSFSRKYLVSDSPGNQLFDINTSNIQVYGINITQGTLAIMEYTAQNCYGSPSATPPTTNNTAIDPSSFYTILNYSAAEAEAISQIGGRIEDLSTIIENMFSIIFSTPLAIYFFSIFNYFTLSSLYVYLDIRTPQLVFNYLSIITESAQADIISQLGVQIQVKPLSVERVNDSRMLYFGVSSDLFTVNLVSFIIVIVNILLYQFILFIVGKHCLQKKRPYQFLLSQRIDIYWGLLVSNVVPLILPWKYAIFGGSTDFPSKMNLGAQYLILCIIPFLLVVSLLNEFRKAKKKEGKSKFKEALLEWWNSYQNFIYPLLLLRNPIYFLVMIGLGNLFVFCSSFKTQGCRSLAILKSSYPLMFHSCFVIFMTSEDQTVLVYSSIVCLAVFLMGSIHHLLETIITSLRWCVVSIKKSCFDSKIAPLTKAKPMQDQKEPKDQEILTEEKKKQRNSKTSQARARLRVNFEEANSVKSGTSKTISYPKTIFQGSYTTKIKMTRDGSNIHKNTLMIKQTKEKTTFKN